MKRTTKLMVILALLSFLLPYSANANPRTYKMNKVLPGGINVYFAIVTLDKYKKEVNEVFEYTYSETSRIADLFNSNNPNSDLSRLADAAGKNPIEVSKETFVLAQKAKEIAEWTAGAFDPVRGGTYKKLKINKKDKTLFLKKAGLTLDLSGILEGFIADLYIRAAHHANLSDAFVTVNGVSRSMGNDVVGPWMINLLGNSSAAYAKTGMRISISNYSAATVGGGTLAPMIDPRSGKTVNSPFYSVTVLAQEAAIAQGVATSIYIGGKEMGENLIKALGIRAVFAYPNETIQRVGKW